MGWNLQVPGKGPRNAPERYLHRFALEWATEGGLKDRPVPAPNKVRRSITLLTRLSVCVRAEASSAPPVGAKPVESRLAMWID